MALTGGDGGINRLFFLYFDCINILRILNSDLQDVSGLALRQIQHVWGMKTEGRGLGFVNFRYMGGGRVLIWFVGTTRPPPPPAPLTTGICNLPQCCPFRVITETGLTFIVDIYMYAA